MIMLSPLIALTALLQAAEPETDAPVSTRLAPETLQASAPAPETLAPATLAPEREPAQEIARVEAYLEGLDTLQARFLQIAPDGTQTQGTLSLNRPGRARFEYDDPALILVVADGTTIAVQDFALDTVDRAPIGSTPLRWLLTEDIDLSAAGAVVGVDRSEGRLFLTVEDPEGETEGRLTLIFADPDASAPASAMSLAEWYAIDALGSLTQVRLSEIERGVRLDPRLFILDDEPVDDRRRNRR